MPSKFIELCSLYADRKYSGNIINLNNVSHSVIRDLEIKGETSEIGDGDKSPDNPYIINHCENTLLTITKENIANPNNAYFNSNITASSCNIDGTYISGTSSPYGSYMIGIQIKVEPNKTYYVNNIIWGNNNEDIVISPTIYQLTTKVNNRDYRALNAAKITNTTYNNASFPIQFTTTSNCKYIIVGVTSNRTNEGDTLWIDEVDVGLSTRDNYIPYTEQTFNIPYTLKAIGDVYDSFNMLSGEYTQRIGSYTITGSENWSLNQAVDNGYLYVLRNIITDYDQHNIEMQMICTHFNFVKTYNSSIGAQQQMICNEISFYAHKTASSKVLYICSECATVDDFKAMLQEQYNNETPVVIYYWLAEPTVVQGTQLQPIGNVPNTSFILNDDLGNINVTMQTKE